MARNGIYPASVQPGIPRLGKKPRGWEKVSVSDVFHIVERKAEIEDDNEYQLVTVKRSRGGIQPRQRLKGSQIKTKTQFYIKSGDFLISKRQIVHGACGIVPDELEGAIVSNEYVTLASKDETLLDYMKFFSNSIHFQQTCFHSSVGVHVEKMIFRINKWFKFQFYLPPHEEQQIICNILNVLDTVIENTERLLDKKSILKKTLMLQFLTNKLSFKDVKGKKWKEFQLGELFKERIETNCHSLPLLSITSGQGVINRDELDKKDTSAKDKDKYKRIVPGDIGYNTMRMWQGVSALSKLEGIVSPAYTICIPQSKIDGQFAKYLFKIKPMIHKFYRFSQGLVDDTRNLKFNNFAQIKVVIPDIAAQKRIAKVLNLADKEISFLEITLTALQNQRKGMMQKLLTGQIRVRV